MFSTRCSRPNFLLRRGDNTLKASLRRLGGDLGDGSGTRVSDASPAARLCATGRCQFRRHYHHHCFPDMYDDGRLPLKFVPTCDLYDEYLDRGIRVVSPRSGWMSYGGRERFCGPAVTVQCFGDNSRIKELLTATSLPSSASGTSPPDSPSPSFPYEHCVLVVDGGGLDADCALLGDDIASRAMANRWAGIVVHGRVRDVDVLKREMGDLGIMALGCTPRKSTRRGQGISGVPVRVDGVAIEQGDLVYCDLNGMVVLSGEVVFGTGGEKK